MLRWTQYMCLNTVQHNLTTGMVAFHVIPKQNICNASLNNAIAFIDINYINLNPPVD